MTTIGQTLAAAREQTGYTLAEVSERTCIRRSILAALERDEFAPCGGDFYARGHIRAVCKELGLDSGPLLEQYDNRHAEAPPMPLAAKREAGAQETAAEPEADPAESVAAIGGGETPEPSEATAEDERESPSVGAGARRRVWPFFVAAAIIVAGVVAGVQAWPESEPEDRGSVPAGEESTSGPVPEAPGNDRSEARPADDTPDSPQATQQLHDPQEVHVKLRAQDRLWIRVTDADGGDVFTGVLTDGTHKDWSHPEELRMHLGNAGAARVEVNGENLGTAGASGEVANLVFDSDGMQSR
ncbi:helix-turn-helix domain-containing protein [Allosalinactinospora lopnorensis]|uniref:helix-turn-helix domain-containing protein n=1 Tax=Allosalinactinospora lopnorensis TaxID=1352348 RepID=UPI000623DE2C|nr:helix-turn-helix domain-containing protein [Allosalinactinospora lopnorensis]